VLCCFVLYCAVLYCAALYCTCGTVLYCTRVDLPIGNQGPGPSDNFYLPPTLSIPLTHATSLRHTKSPHIPSPHIMSPTMSHQRNITHVFDLKGSSRARYVNVEQQTTQGGGSSDKESGREKEKERGRVDSIDEALMKRRRARRLKAAASAASSSTSTSAATNSGFGTSSGTGSKVPDSTDRTHAQSVDNTQKKAEYSSSSSASNSMTQVLLDDNLMELTNGRPFPLKHRAKVPYYTTPYCTVLHCTELYCTVLYCTELHIIFPTLSYHSLPRLTLIHHTALHLTFPYLIVPLNDSICVASKQMHFNRRIILSSPSFSHTDVRALYSDHTKKPALFRPIERSY
jgi:hypothetical protein